ncbi:unnamed protein product [Mesocestoides corti]|uniref:Fibronectin type-III domain-containing protein n=2 Tax=Mesocestoides corti TaxID=53468 RepID=A0A0R3UDL5_MESCO|nr:unnamed protein product [Mesocestoides corti]
MQLALIVITSSRLEANTMIFVDPPAPAVVTVTSVSTTSVVVRVEKPTDATGIGRYEVRVDGVGTTPACTIPSGDKLECQVDGLRPGTEYKVAVNSCISGTAPAVCSEDTRASGWTRPNGEFN